MRSLLLVPLHDVAAIDAAFTSGADALVLDLAGVRGEISREDLRRAAHDALRAAQLATEWPHLYVRLDDLDGDSIERDLAAVMVGEPDGILLAGSRSGADVQHLGAMLAVQEAEYGLADGETTIIAEAGGRAQSLFGLGSYAASSERLIGLTWDAERLAADLGCLDDGGEAAATTPLHTARHFTLFAARAAEVAAIDSAGVFGDPDVFAAACRDARRHGFNAKIATTAAEVAIINTVFGYEADAEPWRR